MFQWLFRHRKKASASPTTSMESAAIAPEAIPGASTVSSGNQLLSARTPMQVASPVEAALDAFLGAPTWPETFRILQAQADLLVSDDAINALRQRITERQRHPEGEGHSAAKLQEHLDILVNAQHGDLNDAMRQFVRGKMLVNTDPKVVLLLRLAPRIPGGAQMIETLVDAAVSKMLLGDAYQFDPNNWTWLHPANREIFSQALPTEEDIDRLVTLGPAIEQLLDGINPFDQTNSGEQGDDEEEEEDEDEEESEFGLIDVFDNASARPHQIALLEQMLSGVTRPDMRAVLQMQIADGLQREYDKNPLEGRQTPAQLAERIRKLESALRYAQAAAELFPRATAPVNWASNQLLQARIWSALGRVRDDAGQSQERALILYEHVLDMYSRTQHPLEWASLQEEVALAYWRRVWGAEDENIEQALFHLNQALEVFTQTEHEGPWTKDQWRLGDLYVQRIQEDHQANLEQALVHYNYTIDSDPLFADVFFDIHLGRATACEQLGNWAEAHASLLTVRKIQHEWSQRVNNEGSQTNLIARNAQSNIYLRDARALLQLSPPDLQGAAEALEDGHAQQQRLALNRDQLDLQRTTPERAHEFAESYKAWRTAQQMQTAPLPPDLRPSDASWLELQKARRQQLLEAHARYLAAREAIRQDVPEFLAPAPTFHKDIADAVTTDHEALVYLTVGDDLVPGFALAVTNQAPYVHIKMLPDLVLSATEPLLMTADQIRFDSGEVTIALDRRPTGGYYLAQVGLGFDILPGWGTTLHDAYDRLPQKCGLAKAINKLPSAISARFFDTPFEGMDPDDKTLIAQAFRKVYLSEELQSALQCLSDLGLSQVAQWLADLRIETVRLVPLGQLGLFPLPAVSVTVDGQTQCFGDRFEVTIVASARALAIAKARASSDNRIARPGILAVGDPTRTDASRLPYAESEADMVRKFIQHYCRPLSEKERETYGLRPEKLAYLVHERAKKPDVVTALRHSWLAWLAVHGQYDLLEPNQSQLLLAFDPARPHDSTTITLEECLLGAIDLKGMRLLVLSACEQSIFDISRAPDEMLGMPNGLVQAGVAGVLAPLWAVDDRATFLLMTRFAKLFLDPHQSFTPAQALAIAQQWLRQATNGELARYDPIALPSQPRSLRLSYQGTMRDVHEQQGLQDPNLCPYSEPFYWAGFTITGS